MPNAKLRWLTLEDALAAHDHALRSGGVPGVVNLGSIESAIARPYVGYYPTIASKAAALTESLVGNHGFADGNKRTAVILLNLLVERSGCRLRPIDGGALIQEQVERMVLDVASRRLSFDDLVRWFGRRLKSSRWGAKDMARFADLKRQVLDLLELNVRPGSSEETTKRHLPQGAIECATEDSMRAFLCVCRTINSVMPDGITVGTRGLLRTSTEGVGLAWQESTGRKREIQAVLLPTKPRWRGRIEAFIRGHERTPVSAPAEVNEPHLIGGKPQRIGGKPNFHIVARPSAELVEQLIDAYKNSSL